MWFKMLSTSLSAVDFSPPGIRAYGRYILPLFVLCIFFVLTVLIGAKLSQDLPDRSSPNFQQNGRNMTACTDVSC